MPIIGYTRLRGGALGVHTTMGHISIIQQSNMRDIKVILEGIFWVVFYCWIVAAIGTVGLYLPFVLVGYLFQVIK